MCYAWAWCRGIDGRHKLKLMPSMRECWNDKQPLKVSVADRDVNLSCSLLTVTCIHRISFSLLIYVCFCLRWLSGEREEEKPSRGYFLGRRKEEQEKIQCNKKKLLCPLTSFDDDGLDVLEVWWLETIDNSSCDLTAKRQETSNNRRSVRIPRRENPCPMLLMYQPMYFVKDGSNSCRIRMSRLWGH